MSLVAGAKLGPYEIVAPIGVGGMGEVYRARDERLGRDVAVKVLPVSFSADAERLRRFEQEARAAGVRNHPGITAVFDIGTHAGAPFLVQELLDRPAAGQDDRGEPREGRAGSAHGPPDDPPARHRGGGGIEPRRQHERAAGRLVQADRDAARRSTGVDRIPRLEETGTDHRRGAEEPK